MTPAWNRLLTLVRLDAKLAARHKLVHVTLVVAALFGALIALFVPEQLDIGSAALPDTLAPSSAAPAPTVLEPDAVKPPFDALMLAVMYTLDLCLLGFMFGSVMLLQDKDQGTIRYFRVGPGTALDYVGSKLAVNLGLSLLNFAILTGIVAPWALLEPDLLALAVLICVGMTALGMTIAVYVRSLSQWFFPMIAVSMIGTLPVTQLMTPNHALDWTWWLPTHHMLFGAESLMFDRHAEVGVAALIYAASFCVLAAAICAVAVRTRLLREVH